MKTLTADEIMALEPCYKWTEMRVRDKFAYEGLDRASALDVARASGLTWCDRFWLLAVLTEERVLRAFAVVSAAHAGIPVCAPRGPAVVSAALTAWNAREKAAGICARQLESAWQQAELVRLIEEAREAVAE
jgi:hypothetical protein